MLSLLIATLLLTHPQDPTDHGPSCLEHLVRGPELSASLENMFDLSLILPFAAEILILGLGVMCMYLYVNGCVYVYAYVHLHAYAYA